MDNCKVSFFIVDDEEGINQKLEDDFLSPKGIINIESMNNGKLKVYYRKPMDWDLINCFIELPDWVKRKYNVRN